MIYNHLERIRKEIETTKDTILDIKVIKTINDYQYRTGFLMGLQRALELVNANSHNFEIEETDEL